MIFKENNKAIYLQIADMICDQVLAGTLAAGARIPSVREYAASLEVNANTVMRSYDHLEPLGVIFNKRGVGFFICDDAMQKVSAEKKQTFLNEETDYFFRQLMLLGITPKEIGMMYENYLKTNKS